MTSPDSRDAAIEQLRHVFEERTERFVRFDEVRRRVDALLLARTMESYRRLLDGAGLLPLGERRILDVGSGRNEFLVACRQDWGHCGEGLCGIDLMPDRVEAGLKQYPYLTLVCGSADRLDWPDASFDLVHQGMLLTSILDPALLKSIVAEMRRVTRPGGYVLWYDFVWNPVNKAARGIGLSEMRGYFPGWPMVARRRVTVAPPIARRLCRIWPPLVGAVEACRVLNLWELVLLQKPEK